MCPTHDIHSGQLYPSHTQILPHVSPLAWDIPPQPRATCATPRTFKPSVISSESKYSIYRDSSSTVRTDVRSSELAAARTMPGKHCAAIRITGKNLWALESCKVKRPLGSRTRRANPPSCCPTPLIRR